MSQKTRGGARPGSGRPRKDTVGIHVRINKEAYMIISNIRKKGEYISEAIKKFKEIIWGEGVQEPTLGGEWFGRVNYVMKDWHFKKLK